MQLKITCDMLRHAWNYHAASGPMLKWNLPDAEDVDLRVGGHKGSTYATTWFDKGRLWITFNNKMHGTTDTLMRTMAHEMIHWHLFHSDIKDTSDHGKIFQRYALAVCKFHGYDPLAFTC